MFNFTDLGVFLIYLRLLINTKLLSNISSSLFFLVMCMLLASLMGDSLVLWLTDLASFWVWGV